ncbi:hypothetical protein IFO70_10450 [Phormidium tenue FACHB-886]|nr:hypothetical protein [Phormidium tenue FACHB-886]
MKKLLPFSTAPKVEIVPIGNPEIGVIHLQKKRGITPNENPVDLQAEGTRQAQTQLLLESAIARLAKEEEISRKEARKLLFDSSTEADSDAPSMYDYLTPDESKELLNLRDNQAAIAIKAATLFIKHRIAYPVTLTSAVKAEAKTLHAEPLSFEIQAERVLLFDGVRVTVNAYHDAESEEISAKIPAPLEAGRVGYLCRETGYKPAIGAPEWTEEDTKNYLTEELILEIYNFYQLEMAGGEPEQSPAPEAEAAPEGNSALAA